jgi:hypothetical protein
VGTELRTRLDELSRFEYRGNVLPSSVLSADYKIPQVISDAAGYIVRDGVPGLRKLAFEILYKMPETQLA